MQQIITVMGMGHSQPCQTCIAMNIPSLRQTVTGFLLGMATQNRDQFAILSQFFITSPIGEYRVYLLGLQPVEFGCWGRFIDSDPSKADKTLVDEQAVMLFEQTHETCTGCWLLLA